MRQGVAQALAHARGLGVDRLDAQILVAHTLGQPRAWVVAHEDDAALDDDTLAALTAAAAGR